MINELVKVNYSLICPSSILCIADNEANIKPKMIIAKSCLILLFPASKDDYFSFLLFIAFRA